MPRSGGGGGGASVGDARRGGFMSQSPGDPRAQIPLERGAAAAPPGQPPQALHRYRAVRQTSVSLTRPLTPEDQLAQSMPDASPTKWHLAHTTWFWETFLLVPHLA